MNDVSAIIELGTRGIRLLVAKIADGRIKHVIKSTGDLSNLGKEADVNGNLSDTSIKRVTKIAQRYKAIVEEYKADHLYLIATEVVRRAPNQDQLIRSLAEIAPLHVLSSEDEAVCIFIAATAAFKRQMANNQPVLVVDQGGGSTELVLGRVQDGVHVIDGMALAPLGTIALSRIFLDHNYLSDGFSSVQRYVKKTLQGLPSVSSPDDIQPRIAIAHGSAIMIFARGAFREQQGYEPKLRDLHGKMIKSSFIERKIQETIPGLKGIRKSDLGDELGQDSELVTMMSGILTYDEIAKKYGVKDFVLSREGLRFGALLWKTGVRLKLLSHNTYVNE
jgi:exopolyphosphatase/pppGpp-phosphohydrolase